MIKKKILIVSRAFYPIIAPRSFRATELAKEFARKGHEVTVLTHKRDYDYTSFSNEHNIIIKDFVLGNWKEIKGFSYIKKGIKFILNYFFLYPDIQLTSLVKKSLKKAGRYDLLISIAVPYPVHWGVALAIERKKDLCNVWVADCGDPFMGNKELKFGMPFYFRYVENWFCKKPDYLTVPIKEAIDAYPPFCRNKIKVIPQGFNFEIDKKFLIKSENNYPHFLYAGLLSKDIRDPSKFLEYLCTLKNQNFKFTIYTQNQKLLDPFKILLKDKLEIKDYIPREKLLMEMSKTDFLINFENSNNVQSPSKLIDYSLVGKPILSINPRSFNSSIFDEFLTGDYSNQYVIQGLHEYDIKNVSNKFLSLLLKSN